MQAFNVAIAPAKVTPRSELYLMLAPKALDVIAANADRRESEAGYMAAANGFHCDDNASRAYKQGFAERVYFDRFGC